MTKLRLSATVMTSFILFLVCFGIYSFSACRTNPGYADSDEIITVGYVLGVAHPPGYVLQILLTRLWIFLLPFHVSVAYKANLLSSFLQSITLVFIFLSGVSAISLVNSKSVIQEKRTADSKEIPLIAAVGGTLILAFSSLFWLYAGIAEVFPLNNLLICLTIFFSLKWFQSTQTSSKDNNFYWFIATCVIIGLGLAHVQTFVLTLPALALFFTLTVRERGMKIKIYIKKISLAIGIVSLGFLIPSLLLFWLNDRRINVSWYFAQNIHGWLGHLTRQVYSYSNRQGVSYSAYFSKFDLAKYAAAFPIYWQFLAEHFSYYGLVLGFIGFYYLYKTYRLIFWYFLTLFLYTGPFLGMYMGISENVPSNLYYRSEVGLAHRQYLQGEVIFGLLIIFGIYFLITYLAKFIISKKTLQATSILIILLLMTISILRNFQIGYQKNNRIAYEYGKTLLDEADSHSVIICTGDFPCFSLIYLQEVEGYRTDVVVLLRNRFYKHNFLVKNPQYIGYDYQNHEDFMADIVSWNTYQRTTYLTDFNNSDLRYIGLDAAPFYLVPDGYLLRIVKEVPTTISPYSYSLTDKLLSYPISSHDYWMQGINDYFEFLHLTYAQLYLNYGVKDESLKHIKLAAQLNPRYPKSKQLSLELQTQPPNPAYAQGQKTATSSQLLSFGKEKIKEKEISAAVELFKKATLVDPLDSEARLQLAFTYLELGNKVSAVTELHNILKYYPNHLVAQQLLAKL